MGRVDDILRGGFDDFRRFVNAPVAERAALSGEPWRVVATDDGALVDHRGRRIEDLQGAQAFGHRNPHVTAAVRELLDSPAPNWFPSRVNPFAGRLAAALCARAPAYDSATFGGSGSEAVEAAIKLARAATGRPRILGLAGAYHGCTMGSAALMTASPSHGLFAPHLPGVASLPFDDTDALGRELARGDVAAVVVEPVQIEGGVRPLAPAYVAALCELCERHGALLVADEVQTGAGRTGRFLASDAWPRPPDAVTLGKHLGGGLVPVSAMLTRRELWARAYGASFETAEAHNSTFGGHAVGCVAALAALELLTPELVARVARVGAGLRERLRAALAGLPLFDEVRGDGLAIGVALRPVEHAWLTFEHFGLPGLEGRPATGALLCHRLYRRGFHAMVAGHDWRVVRMLPRFDVPEATLAELVAAVAEELAALSELV